jgi:hypothetical protein
MEPDASPLLVSQELATERYSAQLHAPFFFILLSFSPPEWSPLFMTSVVIFSFVPCAG